MPDSEHWARYYEVTVDRPAWETVKVAIAGFEREDRGAEPRERFAVDLGAGAGRDARELLRAGWRVLAVDAEPVGLRTIEERTPENLRPRLMTLVADLGTVDIPQADLVNASLSIPFLRSDAFWSTWRRMREAVRVGGRISAMVFGNRDEGMGGADTTYVEPSEFRASLGPGFDVEHWVDREEDTTLALGQPHHAHRVEIVARRLR